MPPLPQSCLDQLFNNAQTYYGWQDKPVSQEQLQQVYDLMKMGPTSFNCCPQRIIFITSNEAKERLKPHLMEANQKKSMGAPAIALLANDQKFYEHLPKLFPHFDAKSMFVDDSGNPKEGYVQETAFRNSTLQGAYFIMAARSLGLDCGPMSGFDADGVNQEFFADTSYKVNFICNVGYGDEAATYERGYRFGFDEVCEVL